MGYEESLTTVSGVAGADLSADQYRFVKLDANAQFVTCDTLGEQPYGVLQNEPGSGDEASVAIAGITKAQADAAIAAGADVAVSADGDAVTPAAASGNIIVGQAREAASGAGSIIAIDFRSHLGVA